MDRPSQFGELEAEILRRSMMPSEKPSDSPDGRPSKAVNLEMEILRRSMMPSEKQSVNSAPSRSSQMSTTRSNKAATSRSSKVDQKMHDFKSRKSEAGQDIPEIQRIFCLGVNSCVGLN